MVVDKTNGKLKLIAVSKRNCSEMVQEEDEVSEAVLSQHSNTYHQDSLDKTELFRNVE